MDTNLEDQILIIQVAIEKRNKYNYNKQKENYY